MSRKVILGFLTLSPETIHSVIGFLAMHYGLVLMQAHSTPLFNVSPMVKSAYTFLTMDSRWGFACLILGLAQVVSSFTSSLRPCIVFYQVQMLIAGVSTLYWSYVVVHLKEDGTHINFYKIFVLLTAFSLVAFLLFGHRLMVAEKKLEKESGGEKAET